MFCLNHQNYEVVTKCTAEFTSDSFIYNINLPTNLCFSLFGRIPIFPVHFSFVNSSNTHIVNLRIPTTYFYLPDQRCLTFFHVGPNYKFTYIPAGCRITCIRNFFFLVLNARTK